MLCYIILSVDLGIYAFYILEVIMASLHEKGVSEIRLHYHEGPYL